MNNFHIFYFFKESFSYFAHRITYILFYGGAKMGKDIDDFIFGDAVGGPSER